MKKRAPIVIGIPLTDWMPTDFFETWLQLAIPLDVPVVTIRSAYVEAAHNLGVREALEKYDFDKLVWVEQDTLPAVRSATGEKTRAEVFKRWLSYKEPVVGGLYFTRRRPIKPLGFHFDDEVQSARHFTDAETLTFLQQPGLHEVGAVPMGCTVIQREVFEAFPDDEPWYDVPTTRKDDAGGGILSDDIRFCIRARQLGFKVYLDSAVVCEHVGNTRHDERLWIAEVQATGRLAEAPKPKLEVVRSARKDKYAMTGAKHG